MTSRGFDAGRPSIATSVLLPDIHFPPFFGMQIPIESEPPRYQSKIARKEQLDDSIGDTFVSVFVLTSSVQLELARIGPLAARSAPEHLAIKADPANPSCRLRCRRGGADRYFRPIDFAAALLA